ncbi:permease [Lutibacter sp. A80]|uniref:permease n=1 Tax=Lutibacter sp. A80 TaxID=2918453 RepID=UPI001F062752|nr:permease [Lutibacter sp. A80]UMB59931.1 permease [Lutibacter sp. A80]
MSENLKLALDEFIHVGVALFFIIAFVSILTGFVRAYIPQDKLQKKLSKTGKYSGVMGALLGIPTPFCSASMVPVSMGMLEMGAPLAMVFSFLLSAPLANFVVVAFIFAVFGFKVAIVYFLIVFIGAILFGTIVGKTSLVNQVKTIGKKPVGASNNSCGSPSVKQDKAVNVSNVSECSIENQPQVTCGSQPQVSGCTATVDSKFLNIKNDKVREAFEFAWSLFKRIMPYVFIGAVISAVSAAFVPDAFVEKYLGNDNPLAILLGAVIGVPLYLRIEMAIPLLSVLIGKGMSMGAAMALLIGGTGASLPEIAIVSSMLKPKAVAAFVGSIIAIAIIGGFIFYFFF